MKYETSQDTWAQNSDGGLDEALDLPLECPQISIQYHPDPVSLLHN